MKVEYFSVVTLYTESVLSPDLVDPRLGDLETLRFD